MTSSVRPVSHLDGIPVYDYPTDPAIPPVTVFRMHPGSLPEKGRHIHAFPILAYLPASGTVHVVAAGKTIDPAWASGRDDGIAVFFDPGALDDGPRSPWPTWRSHPLLFPFLHGRTGGLLHLQLPRQRKAFWDNVIDSMEAELLDRREGFRQAALAHLTLLLIDLARLTDDMVGDLRRSGEPLIADVFAVIERRIGEPLSLSDVARELGLTPGHLTTVVRRRTGRTVGEWIIERRMSEARTLLGGTDLPIADVARRVGISDPGYFARLFRGVHGVSPRSWRA
ncbi:MULTISPECIES: AraC family transcriptional regulator [unclassified Mycobacterium]|uniref:helix-turn-helix transcriptional regulator n=1 Tax=unclassified Mycobacterium TaxID=2642494 RepID=UPI0029C76781|nr:MULTISPECIES: AraC family transcriptional regulator [unclassified Mycobacterium]